MSCLYIYDSSCLAIHAYYPLIYCVHAGYYRFGSNSETPVRCVYVTCNDNNLCTFMAPKTNTKLPVSAPTNPLSSSDKCVVNYVEMIHDCMPRRVDVTLKFTSYPADNRLYLQVSLSKQRTKLMFNTHTLLMH